MYLSSFSLTYFATSTLEGAVWLASASLASWKYFATLPHEMVTMGHEKHAQ